MLSAYAHVDAVPEDPAEWAVSPRGAASMARQLADRRGDALFYRTLATLRSDAPIAETLDDLRWKGAPRGRYAAFCRRLGLLDLLEAPSEWS